MDGGKIEYPAGPDIVEGIDDNIGMVDQFEHVVFVYVGLNGLHPAVRIEVLKLVESGNNLQLPDVRCEMEYLPVQVRRLDPVPVYDPQSPHPGGSKIVRRYGAEPASPRNGYPCIAQHFLLLDPYARYHYLTGVALELLYREYSGLSVILA